jgi:hypothetical protein
MGPGIGGNPRTMRYSNGGGGLYVEPPVFNIAEKLEYRNGVQRWAKLVATLALTGNKEVKAVSAALTESLIASLPDERQSLVRASVASGDIKLNLMTFKGQLRSVQKVMVLIASDLPTEHVDRVAASFEAVSSCKREKAVRNFSTRFYSKAQTYLRICGGAEADPAGLVLALTFVENANLTVETRAHVKLQLQQSPVLAGRDRKSSGGLSQIDLGTSDDEDDHDYSSDSSSSSEYDDSETTSQSLATRRRRKEKRRESRRRRRERFAVPEGLFEKPSSSVCFTLEDVYKALLVLPDDKGTFRPRRYRQILIMSSTRH